MRLLRAGEPAVAKLNDILRKILHDYESKRIVASLEEKAAFFDRLRDAMKIACKDNKDSLNDDGENVKMTHLESKVKQFRNDTVIIEKASSNLRYKNMLKQIDKYWDKLFADPILVASPNGKILIHPQRTNNILERFFRDIKKDFRRKTGTHSLSKTLKAMLADMPLVKNLANPEYMKILLNGKISLEQRFAEIDNNIVCKMMREKQCPMGSISPKLKKTLRFANFTRNITKKPKSRLAA